ncbi:methionine aminopeptidase 1D, mitochondrial [Rhopalosiphum padi]|uniref:methionine aminopeptidase 1D, mitochondrial n=1 Tax=Rhopalosiphum padi TaxID=40932 RepID=UPI00298D7E2C|nr:methionine aminopeptidase 1D, mitochondrial [Rhopalosiphum padi]
MNICKTAAACGRWFVSGGTPSLSLPPRRLSKSLWTKKFQTNNFGVYDLVELGTVSDHRTVPEYVTLPSYAKTGAVVDEPDHNCPPEIQNRGQIEMLRQSCKLAKFVLDSAKDRLTVGATTDDVDRFVHDLIIDNNAYPSPLNYRWFRKSLCTSINNVVCHGVPDDRPLVDGDIVSVDVSVYLNGFHGDCAATYCVGGVDDCGRKLITVAEQCTYKGIEACGPGKSFADIGRAIELFAREHGYSVASSITGHGIGTYFHGPPTIFHSTMYSYPGVMKPGMVFTVEPVICQGNGDVEVLEDGWTIVTADDSRGAQFEHTILITDSGYDILTV